MSYEPPILRALACLQRAVRHTQIGRVAREAGLGRFLLWLTWDGYHRRNFFGLGPIEYAKFLRARFKHLSAIRRARPLSASARAASFEVHMLLDHARVLEGAWALYSFYCASETSAHTVIHDDGSLRDTDIALLQSLFRPLTVWRRTSADKICNTRLTELGLERLVRLRGSSVFGLKLTDPILLGQTRCIVLLDSDILFFRPPMALLQATITGRAVFSVDTLDSYCLSEVAMLAFTGQSPIRRCNAGLLAVDRTRVDLHRWNEYLAAAEFWNADGSANYYAEQTLWAMELTRIGATELSPLYAICPYDPQNAYCGHYHRASASGHALFYTTGIPYLRRIWAQACRRDHTGGSKWQ